MVDVGEAPAVTREHYEAQRAWFAAVCGAPVVRWSVRAGKLVVQVLPKAETRVEIDVGLVQPFGEPDQDQVLGAGGRVVGETARRVVGTTASGGRVIR